MEEGVEDEGPDHVVEFPHARGRRTDTGQRGVRDFGRGQWDGGVVGWIINGCVGIGGELVAPCEAEPGSVDAGQSAQRGLIVKETEFHQVVKVAKAPGYETEARDAEKGVEDLRVDFDPDAARGVDVVAIFLAM